MHILPDPDMGRPAIAQAPRRWPLVRQGFMFSRWVSCFPFMQFSGSPQGHHPLSYCSTMGFTAQNRTKPGDRFIRSSLPAWHTWYVPEYGFTRVTPPSASRGFCCQIQMNRKTQECFWRNPQSCNRPWICVARLKIPHGPCIPKC